jgi:hypothetical protein
VTTRGERQSTRQIIE